MSTGNRVKRRDPLRTAPIRNMSKLFREPVSPSPPDFKHRDANRVQESAEPWRATIDSGVERAYQVVEDYMRRGQYTAQRHSTPYHEYSYPQRPAWMPPSNWLNMAGEMMNLWRDLLGALMPPPMGFGGRFPGQRHAGQNPLLYPFRYPRADDRTHPPYEPHRAPRDTPARDPWDGFQAADNWYTSAYQESRSPDPVPGDGIPDDPVPLEPRGRDRRGANSGSDAATLTVAVASSRPIEVSVDGPPSVAGQSLGVNLTSADGAVLPDVEFVRDDLSGKLTVRIKVTDEQPVGRYLGVITDGASGAMWGCLSVQVFE